MTRCDMNVITRSSHNITFFDNTVPGKHDRTLPGCDITNHISPQDIIVSVNKVCVMEEIMYFVVVVTCDVTSLRKLFRQTTTLGFFLTRLSTC